jgi:hypothetical protein
MIWSQPLQTIRGSPESPRLISLWKFPRRVTRRLSDPRARSKLADSSQVTCPSAWQFGHDNKALKLCLARPMADPIRRFDLEYRATGEKVPPTESLFKAEDPHRIEAAATCGRTDDPVRRLGSPTAW